MNLSTIAVAFALLGFSATAESQILIDNVAVMAGGLSNGDAPGYPATLSAGGSYKLTGNISSSTLTNPVIDITGSNVTLDLNGFVAASNSTCTVIDPGNSCTSSGGAAIIRVSANNVRIRNGNIKGAQGNGIQLTASASQGATFEDLVIRDNRNYGIDANSTTNAVFTGVQSDLNGQGGIRVGASARMNGVTAAWNNLDGILTASFVGTNLSARGNGQNGISLAWGTIDGAFIALNAWNGIASSAGPVTLEGITTVGHGSPYYGINIASGVIKNSSANDLMRLGFACYRDLYTIPVTGGQALVGTTASCF